MKRPEPPTPGAIEAALKAYRPLETRKARPEEVASSQAPESPQGLDAGAGHAQAAQDSIRDGDPADGDCHGA